MGAVEIGGAVGEDSQAFAWESCGACPLAASASAYLIVDNGLVCGDHSEAS